jgi:hypothetical protein
LKVNKFLKYKMNPKTVGRYHKNKLNGPLLLLKMKKISVP